MPTFEITGEWTGPQSPAGHWTRLQHREFVRVSSKRDREWIGKVVNLGSIRFTDGTALIITVRDVTDAHHSKRGKARPQYSRLIADCVRHGVNAVEDLPKEGETS